MFLDNRLFDSARSVDNRLSPIDNSVTSVVSEYLMCCRLDKKSSNTVASYSRRIRDLCKFLVDNRLPLIISDLTVRHIRFYLADLIERKTKKGQVLSSVTVSGNYRALHSFFVWCVKEGYIKNSPMDLLNPPQLPKLRPQPFSQQDLDNILLLCEGHTFTQVRNKAMVLTFLDTGLRLAEMASIKMKDLNVETGLIKIMGKGAKERTVRIGLTTRKTLLRYLRFRDDRYAELWQTEERRPLTRNGMQIAIVRLCKRAEVKDARCGPHTFRHTFATMALRNNAGEFNVQTLLGHSTLTMTKRYVESMQSERALEAHEGFSPVDRMR